MDTEKEIERLEAARLAAQGEAIAIQAVIIGLCQAIVQSNPEARAVIAHAFDYADGFAEVSSMRMGEKQPAAHLLGVMNTLERLRQAALGGHGEPQSGV